MKSAFPTLGMSQFAKTIAQKFGLSSLQTMHATNPEPFTQHELEEITGRGFSEILKDTPLGFAPDAGTQSLRQVLAKNLYEKISATEIITHAGAQEALFCVFYALFKSGDKVLSLAPVFEPLLQIPQNIGCKISYTHLNENNGWKLDLNDVEKNFKAGCRYFIINFPHNPTGAQLTYDDFNKLIKLCKTYDVWLISDEVFRGLEHKAEHQLPAVADIYDKGISIAVISKAFAIPGIRVGWLVCKNKKLRERILDIKAYLSVCNSQIDECLASTLLKSQDKLLERNLALISNNQTQLNTLTHLLDYSIEFQQPLAGCCLFIKVKNIDSNALIMKVAEQTKLLLYPSKLFTTNINALRMGFGSRDFPKHLKKLLANFTGIR